MLRDGTAARPHTTMSGGGGAGVPLPPASVSPPAPVGHSVGSAVGWAGERAALTIYDFGD